MRHIVCVPFAGLVRKVGHLGGDSVVQFDAVGFRKHDPLVDLILPTYKHTVRIVIACSFSASTHMFKFMRMCYVYLQ